MRIRPKPHQLEIRLTFNILTLARFVKVDADGDGRIAVAELDAAQPGLADYLNQHVLLEINQQQAALGKEARFDYLWPDAAATPPMSEPEYSGRNADVTFTVEVKDKLLEDFWIGFEIFEQTGPMHTIRGVYEQDGQNTEVQFTAQEPEYLYDTGFADDPFVQKGEKDAKDGQDAPPPASPAETAADEEHWWLVRVGVLLVIMFLGKRAARARRSNPLLARRGRRS